jgi:hypothetical protein
MTPNGPPDLHDPDDPDDLNLSVVVAQRIRRSLRADATANGAGRPAILPRDDWRDDDDNQFVVAFGGRQYLVTVDPWVPEPPDPLDPEES